MSVDTPARAGVSIDALLAAKEQRAARRRLVGPLSAACYFPDPVTLGAVKDSIRYRNMMGVALRACDQLLWKHRWQTLDRQVLWLPTGPEALWCVAHPASEIKAMCSTLEQSHPLGRLWDIDVICPQNGLVGRQSLGESQRRCLLCDEPAHACARSRRHDTDLVVARVEQMIDAWFARD